MLALFTTLLALGAAAQAALDLAPSHYICIESKERVAQFMVREVSGQTYARWSMDNPGRRCPHSGLELAKYLDDREMRDPWETTLVVRCDDATPYGIRVVSAGPDGKFETRDDIRSWDET